MNTLGRFQESARHFWKLSRDVFLFNPGLSGTRTALSSEVHSALLPSLWIPDFPRQRAGDRERPPVPGDRAEYARVEFLPGGAAVQRPRDGASAARPEQCARACREGST